MRCGLPPSSTATPKSRVLRTAARRAVESFAVRPWRVLSTTGPRASRGLCSKGRERHATRLRSHDTDFRDCLSATLSGCRNAGGKRWSTSGKLTLATGKAARSASRPAVRAGSPTQRGGHAPRAFYSLPRVTPAPRFLPTRTVLRRRKPRRIYDKVPEWTSVSHGGTAPTKGSVGPGRHRSAQRLAAGLFVRPLRGRVCRSEDVLLRPEEACHHCRAGCIVPGRARFASSLRGPLAARD